MDIDFLIFLFLYYVFYNIYEMVSHDLLDARISDDFIPFFFFKAKIWSLLEEEESIKTAVLIVILFSVGKGCIQRLGNV